MTITEVTLFRTDGTKQVLDAVPDLAQAQKLVGGYVERVFPKQTPSVYFLCNEEGLLKHLPVNVVGCELYGPTSPIVGDIIVVPRNAKGARRWM